MNTDLTERIREYLRLDTNYAIIISGDYGIGKTYYLRNELFPIVRETDIPDSDPNEKFTPILISLFGVNTIEEIHNKVFTELFPIMKKKGIKIAAGLGSGALKFFTGLGMDEWLKDTDTSSANFFGYRKVLLCIDDIDRKSTDLELEEVYGFVNNLVENLDGKVLLIANEDELRKEFKDDLDGYSLIREKVIGVSFNYSTDVVNVFNQIIETKYKGNETEYYDFLKSNLELIVQRIVQNRSNLRNLLFFTEHFKVIYKGLSQKLKEQGGLSSVFNEIYQSVLHFSLPVAIEYKLGKLSRENFEEIKDLYRGSLLSLSDLLSVQSKTDKEPTYRDIYKENYITGVTFRRVYFDSVFSYLVGEAAFNIEDLIREINKSYSVTDEGIPERELALEELSYWKCVDLPSSEYRRLTMVLLKNVDAGMFSLEQYPQVFHYVTRFQNMLKYDIPKLVLRFKRGIRRGFETYNYKKRLRMRMALDEKTEFVVQIKEIIEYCETVNNEIKGGIDEQNSSKLLKLYEEDFSSFIELAERSDSEIYLRPFFTEIDFKRFWRFFRKLNNSEVIELGFYFASRYELGINEKLLPEREFVDNLMRMLKSRINKKGYTKLTKASYSFLLEKLEGIVPNFPEIE